MRKSFLIIAMGIFGTAAFAQDASKKLTNPNKLKVRVVEKKSVATLQPATRTSPTTTPTTTPTTRTAAPKTVPNKSDVTSKKLVVRSVTKQAVPKKSVEMKSKSVEK